MERPSRCKNFVTKYEFTFQQPFQNVKMMDGDDLAVQTFTDSLKNPFGDDDQFNDFLMPELKQPDPGFATTQTTPGSVHAHQQLTSPTYSPPEQKDLIPHPGNADAAAHFR
jgi:hypothetical protein